MSLIAAFVVFVMVATSFMAVMASAESDPEVWTDSDEYAPGETVYIFGDGFVKWVPVEIELEHPDLGTKFFTATPAIDGSFVFSGYQAEWVENPDLAVNVTVTQELSTGDLVATTQFWDPGAFIEGYTLAPHLRWTMGDIKGYNEGDSVPFSVVLSSQHLGDIGSITIELGFDYRDDNSPTNPTYGIDYLTGFWGDPWTGPYNGYPALDEPFAVDESTSMGTITDQGFVRFQDSDEGENQMLMIYSFTIDLASGYDIVIVRFGAHLAVTDLGNDYLGASYYPGSALHVRMVMTDPETNEGHRDVPIMLGDVLIPPEMTLEKECDPEIVVQGDEITFELTWSNIGQAYASCLVFHDDLPTVVDIDPTSFLYWTSANPTPMPATPMPTVSGDTWDWSLGYWPGTGADGSAPPLVGHLSFTATVNTNVPGWYYNWANLTFQDNHGGYYPPVVAWCKFLILAEPSITIEKTGPEYAHVGDLITYEYTVTNIGDVDLKDVTIDDPLIDSDPIVEGETLAVGESKKFYETYTVLGTDPDPLPNTATVTAEDDYCRTTTDDDSWEVDILHPDILVYKTVDPGCAKPGEAVTYTIWVENPSEDTDLYEVTVVDSMFGTWVVGTLLAESTHEFAPIVHTVTLDDDDPLVNIVTAEGKDLLDKVVSAEARATVEVYHPMIEVEKTADKSCAEIGEVVTYTITVSNPSWDTIMWAHVEDGKLGIDETVELAPESSETWTKAYTVLATDPDPLVNTVHVDAWDVQNHHVSADASWTVDIYHPMIEVTKVGSLRCAAAGDEIVYWINVTNPSTDTPMDTVVYDAMFGGVVWSGLIVPKETVPLVFTHLVVSGEMDPLVNEVTVTAEDPQDHPAEDSASWSVDIYHPDIEVTKTADLSCAMAGETVTYTITVTAPSADTPMYVEVYDAMFGGYIFKGNLAGGASWSESFTHTVTVDDPDPLVNEVWVDAWDPQEHYAFDSAEWTVNIYHPAIEILKIADLECAGVGDVITYTIFLTNPSDDTPLLFVQVSDDMFGGVIWTGSLDPLESVILNMPLLTHTVTVNDPDPIENTATVYATDPQDHEVEGSSTWSVDFVHPDVLVEKIADKVCAAVDEEVEYTIYVTNPASADVWLNGTVTDDMLGQSWTFTNLMPGVTIEYTYTMRMPDIDPFVNTVEVVAYDHQFHEVTASDSWKVDVVHPDVEITKEADLTCAAVDEEVTYTIVVTNPASADVWLNGTVYDDTLDVAWKFANLKPGESLTYEITVAMPDVDPFVNTAHVVAYDHQLHEVTDEASWSVDVVHPEIMITKEGSMSCAAVGEFVTYWITVENPEWADVWLNGTVTDDMLGQTWTFENLRPGEMRLFEYSMAMPDVDPFINTARVVAYDHQLHMVDGSASWKVDVVHPDIEVTKTTDDVVCAHVGEEIVYVITVTVPAECDVWMNGTVYDDDLGWWASFENLRPGQSIDWKLSYLVTEETPDPFTNHVFVEAYDHQFHLETDYDSWTVDILHPEILVTKVGPEKADVGETITYYVTVTNTGDTPLYYVAVVDSLVGVIGVYSVLDIGETEDMSYTYVVPAGVGTLDNVVTAEGVDKQDVWVNDTAEWTVFKYGVVTGYKVLDLNENGIVETSDPGISMWMIVLSGTTVSGDSIYWTRLTDSFGYYEFKSVDAGTYTVSEIMVSGWYNTLPISSSEFGVGSGTTFACDFANVPTGSISGYKWHDVDIDGIWDDGEFGIEEWTIYLTGIDANGMPVEIETLTDANGYYEFTDLLPGVYDVSEETVDGWFATVPVMIHVDVSTLVPFEVTDVNFGNAKYGRITGFKWLDEYMNGYRDANEPLLPGWTIILEGEAVDGTKIGPLYAVTDANGYYSFDNLLPGEYTVSEVLQPGWYAVTPSSRDVTLIEGSEVTCAKFGNVEYSEINGWKFLDWDMDGFKDGDEPGIAGWEITIEGWLNDGTFPGPVYPFDGCTHIGPITITTDANGYWVFDDLLPGIYIVTEATEEGWYHTTDPSVTLIVTSGSYLYDIKFGNVPYTCFWGYKVNDTNGDGRWGEGELGIPGWTIIVEGVRNDGVPVYIELTTDEDGYWETCFNMLPGTYWIYEVQQEDWIATSSPEVLFEIPMTVFPWVDYGFVFLNFELGKISGYKYEDKNGNGILDAGDEAVEGWLITLSGAMSATTMTDANGYYEFDGLLYGTYTVTEEDRAGWVAMSPTYYTVDIISGSDVVLDIFLNVELGKIWGYKFEDLNSNGVWDKGEPGIEDWTIYMMWDNDPKTYFTTTDSNGYYEFDMLMPNEFYLVWEELRDGWTPTTDSGALVSLESGDRIEIPAFGNFHNVDITVFKYEDVNSNGVYDEGDNPLPGWSIVVSGPGVPGGIVTLVTDADGYASVEVTAAGTYIVEELMQEGWCNILPVVQYADVISGYVDPKVVVFGNFECVTITLFKYEDVDSNGIFDGDDIPLSGWTFYLDSLGGEHLEVVTGADGTVQVTFCRADMWMVTEEERDGWCMITPVDGYYIFTVYSGFVLEDQDRFEFGNFQCVTIIVFKYWDKCSNGWYDPAFDDEPISRWHMELYGPDGELLESGYTDEDGYIVWTVCAAGTYTVVEEDREGWSHITPLEGYYEIEILSGDREMRAWFGNYLDVEVPIFKYEDVNSNGVFDEGDRGVPDWYFELVRDDGTVYSGYTDSEGWLVITVNRSGMYTVYEELRDDWTPINPAVGMRLVNIVSGTQVPVQEFGNFHDVTITVFKFQDMDGDGMYDDEDTPLADWEFIVTGPWSGSGTVIVTGLDGYASIVVDRAGWYYIDEVVQPGWTPTTYPHADAWVMSGSEPNTILFGNFKDVELRVFKYEDVNSNGVYDDGIDRPLSGWTIQLYSEAYGYLMGTTGTDGFATFILHGGGLWYIVEYLEIGWCQISPDQGYYTYYATSGDTPDAFEFGNFRCVTIDVFKYEDVNSNGVYDAGDQPLEGWYFELYTSAGELDAYGWTDETGHLYFYVCHYDLWTVVEEDRQGWTHINPASGSMTVETPSSAEPATLEFGNFMDVWIVVFKYHDRNSNGVYDDGDAPVEDWMFSISGPGVTDSVAYTDAYGYAYFRVVRAGTYTITEEDQPGWVHVNPVSGILQTTVSSGGQPGVLMFGNFELVTIWVFKYDDILANGRYSPGEGDLPIEGWMFELYLMVDDEWVLVDTQYTDENGYASFVIDRAGYYMIKEELPTGWKCITHEGGEADFAVLGGYEFEVFEFGNFKLGKIYGWKWNDINGNGVWDEGEPALSGWKIWFECTSPYYLTGWVVTNENGYYEFTGLPTGVYRVWEVGQSGWVPTSDDQVTVEIIGHTEARVDFFNFQLGCITGYKYEDMNGDGLLDKNDTPLADWTIYLMDVTGRLIAMTTTDASGFYSFCGLGPGTYIVSEEARTGWVATNEPSETVVMLSGATIVVHTFLNFELGCIYGYKFEDLNSNGVWDDGEEGIEDWEINMMIDSIGYDLTYTDAGGMFVFSGLMANWYLIWETMDPDWTATTQDWALVTIYSGDCIEIPAFGNFHNVDLTLFKYEDVDGNGGLNGAEEGLEGWMFAVTGPCFDTPFLVRTDMYGYAYVTLTAAGEYTVVEEDRANWMHVTPADGTMSVDVQSGDMFKPLMFGNFELGQITGQKFYDWNKNGIMDGGEYGLAGWVIWVNGTLVGGGWLNFTRITDSNGLYSVAGLPAGTYVVSERLEYAAVGWTPMTPTSVPVSITSGKATGVSFGNVVFGVIEGYKFYDKDLDGWMDEGEPGLGGWTIVLEGYTDAGEYVYRTTVTAGDGKYVFNEVLPGVYDVYEILWPDWAPTTPLPVHVSVSGAMVYFDIWVNIGNVRYATVYGWKFQDLYGDYYPYWPNGVFDEGEWGIGNWEITLQGWTTTGVYVDRVVYTDNTEDIGYYQFGELLPGTYWVNETLLEHWYATRPISNLIVVYPFPMGQVKMRIDFGNTVPDPDPEVNFVLKKGANLWSSPLEIPGGLTASELASAIGPSVVRISVYDTVNRVYTSYVPGFTKVGSEDDFPIELGEGYLVFVRGDVAFTLEGVLVSEGKANLDRGVNIMGYTEMAPITASELAASIVGAKVYRISYYDTAAGGYVSFVPGFSLPGGADDFTVTQGRAYLVITDGAAVAYLAQAAS